MTTLNIYDLWQKLMSIVNVQQGGQIRPVTDFQNWLNAINLEIFHEWAAKMELNQQMTDELMPFKASANVMVNPSPGQPFGIMSVPSNYEYFVAARYLISRDNNEIGIQDKLPFIDGNGNCTQYVDPDYAALRAKYAGDNLEERNIQLIESQRWAAALGHVTKGPNVNRPYITQYSGGFKVAPKKISTVVLDYLRTPRNCVFAYTIGAGDIVVYNAGASTQLEWTNALQNEFLTRLVKKYGMHVREDSVYQMGNNDQKELV